MVSPDFEITQSLLLKRANKVLISIKDALQMRLFRKLVVLAVSSNKLRKIVLTNSVELLNSKIVAMSKCTVL